MQKTCVQSLGQEDSLEREMATHSSVLAWRVPWTEEPGGYSPGGCRFEYDWATNTFTFNDAFWGHLPDKNLPPNPYLRVCLWGNLTKDPTFPPSLVHKLEVELILPLS